MRAIHAYAVRVVQNFSCKFSLRLSLKGGFGGLRTPNGSLDTKGERTDLGPLIMLK